jgi:hypothetical protein
MGSLIGQLACVWLVGSRGRDGFDPDGPAFGLRFAWVGMDPDRNIPHRCGLV